MPNTDSAWKAMRQSRRRRARLVPVRTFTKTTMKKFRELVSKGKTEEAKTLLPAVYKAIDMAAKKRIFHRKNAARKKSKMARLLTA